jgi:excisionase family DNA binding protein
VTPSEHVDPSQVWEISVNLPPELLGNIVERVAAIVLAQLGDRDDERWPAAMNIETAAQYLDSPPERLRKLIARRAIPFVQEAPGCAIRLLRDDLDEWLRAQRVSSRRGAA